MKNIDMNHLPTSYPLLIIEKWLNRAAFGFPVVPDENWTLHPLSGDIVDWRSSTLLMSDSDASPRRSSY